MGNIDVCRFLSWLKCVGNQTTILMQVCWRIWKTGIIRAFRYQRFYRWPPQIYIWIPFWRKLNVSWHDFHRLIVYLNRLIQFCPLLVIIVLPVNCVIVIWVTVDWGDIDVEDGCVFILSSLSFRSLFSSSSKLKFLLLKMATPFELIIEGCGKNDLKWMYI